MKLVIVLGVLFFITSDLDAQPTEMMKLRESYYRSSEDAKMAESFYELLESSSVEQPLRFGYFGMANFMLAYHSLNPFDKFKYFIAGKEILADAISAAPQNTELRYLRFTVQTNAPAFLNYRRHLSEDKQVLLNTLSSKLPDLIDNDLRMRISKYLQKTKFCTLREKESLAKLKLNREKM